MGIYITENLKWVTHARLLRAQPCKVVHMMKTLKETMSPCMIRNNNKPKFWEYTMMRI